MMTAATLYIGCGTYDGSVLCYEYDLNKMESNKPSSLELRFVDPEAHNSSVRSVTFTKQLLLSGSTDEYIKLFSIQNKSKLGMLDLHSGTVKKLVTHSDSTHFLSCSSDCTIALWRGSANGRDFECIRHLKRHKGGIEGLALHPSGRLAISISQDKTMRIWDLMHGRQAYTTRMKLCANDICFNKDGTRFVLLYNSHIDVFHTAKSQLECSIQLEGNFNAFEFIGSDVCVVVVDKTITAYKLGNKISILGECDLASCKIKDMKFISCQLESNRFDILVTIRTDNAGSVVSGYRLEIPITQSSFQLSDDNKLFSHSQAHIRITSLAAHFADSKFSNKESKQDSDEELSVSGKGFVPPACENSDSHSDSDEMSNFEAFDSEEEDEN